ncbi:MAG: hypothetical protein ACLFUH_10470 [Bacteroidales bacterium]
MRLLVSFLCVFLFFQQSGEAQNPDSTIFFGKKTNDSISQHFEGNWFLGYRNSSYEPDPLNKFTLKRSYITFKHKFNKTFDVRFTQDITLDKEGDDAGNVETRLKYCYLNMNLEDFIFINNPYIEGGLVHRPWLDFEQKINHYRVQGSMFLERIGMFNSADFGITFGGLFGGEIDEDYQKNVSSSYPGRYGSFAIGVYNGGGYHALEYNESKTIEARLTIRPFPENLPGAQFSYTVAHGKGNTELEPDFHLHSGFFSYENRNVVLTAQYYTGEGNSSGSFIDNTGNALSNDGYSFFGEYRIPKTSFAVFGRYDKFISCDVMFDKQRYIGGLAYYFYKKNKFVIDVDYLKDEQEGIPDRTIFEAIVEIKF